MDSAHASPRKSGRISAAAATALVIMIAISSLAAWGTHSVVRDQERRLLNERAGEVGLVFTSSVGSVTNSFNSIVGSLRVTTFSQRAFAKSASSDTSQAAASKPTLAFVRQEAAGYRVIGVHGPLLKMNQLLTGPRAAALRVASDKLPTATGVLGSGAARSLGFALRATGISGVTGNVFLYRETFLGKLSAGRQAASAPFHEVDVVLYASAKADPRQLLISTTGGSIPSDNTRFLAQQAAASTWLLGVHAKGSLVGTVASNAWWVVFVGIAVAGLLLASMIQFAVRRRDVALSLYAAEHQQAETLQRSLLPSLPSLPGLDLAARYEAGGVGQQVGGDWFDVFPLPGGGAGFAIGDVMGHDLEAAAAMSQVRAALRAYAYDGASPIEVLTRLDNFVLTFDLTQLVSVVYGILSPVHREGTRTVTFANAGHLPPLMQAPDGSVSALVDGASVVIGVPFVEQRIQATRLLQAGSTLLLFTDGLLEAPDLSLAETIPALERTVAGHLPADGCDALCDRVLAARVHQEQAQRDDIALLALRLEPSASRNLLPGDGQAERESADGSPSPRAVPAAPADLLRG
jgi:serine phosphatase RsbU (regulator of sigma subunit)